MIWLLGKSKQEKSDYKEFLIWILLSHILMKGRVKDLMICGLRVLAFGKRMEILELSQIGFISGEPVMPIFFWPLRRILPNPASNYRKKLDLVSNRIVTVDTAQKKGSTPNLNQDISNYQAFY